MSFDWNRLIRRLCHKISYPPRILEHRHRHVLNLEMSELTRYSQLAIDSGWPVITLSFWSQYDSDQVLYAESRNNEVITGEQISKPTREILFASPNALLHSRLLCG